MIISVTIILYGSYIWLTTWSYLNFTGDLNISLISLNVIVSTILTVLIFIGVREGGSLLTTGALILYSSYLQWSALASDPNPSFNSLLRN